MRVTVFLVQQKQQFVALRREFEYLVATQSPPPVAKFALQFVDLALREITLLLGHATAPAARGTPAALPRNDQRTVKRVPRARLLSIDISPPWPSTTRRAT